MSVSETEFEGSQAKEITLQQINAIDGLIEKLAPSEFEEDNLNSCSVLQDLLENKEFYV